MVEKLEDIIERAKEEFGTTRDWRETGWLFKDGTQLDLSGKNFGGRGGKRTVEHREIFDDTDDMIEFMSQGNIRISPETPGINLQMEPTEEQYEKIKAYIESIGYRDNYFAVDFDNKNGDTIDHREYDDVDAVKIIRDIENYFKNGRQAYRSELQQFREDIEDETINESNTLYNTIKHYFGDRRFRVSNIGGSKINKNTGHVDLDKHHTDNRHGKISPEQQDITHNEHSKITGKFSKELTDKFKEYYGNEIKDKETLNLVVSIINYICDEESEKFYGNRRQNNSQSYNEAQDIVKKVKTILDKIASEYKLVTNNINEKLLQKTIAYHGSQQDNLEIEDRPLYLTNNKEVAIDFAEGYNFGYRIREEEKPTVYTIEIDDGNYKEITTEEEYEEIMDIVNIEETKKTYADYDGIIYEDENGLIYYLIFDPVNKCKIIEKENINKSKLEESKYIDLNVDYEEIDDYIKKNYGQTKDLNSLKTDSQLINREGYFVDLGKDETHIKILRDLVDKGLIKSKDSELDEMNLINTDLFTDLGYIRLNSNIYDYTYVQLPKKQITSAQYDTLTKWLDDLASRSDIVEGEIHISLDVSIVDGPAKWYSYVESVDYIIDRIKRYYASGKLYESMGINEWLEEMQPDMWITDNPYDIKRMLMNKPKFYRVLYDNNLKLYMICDGSKYIHRDMILRAERMGYLFEMRDFIDQIGAIDNYIEYGQDGGWLYNEETEEEDEWVDDFLIYMVFTDKDDFKIGDDDYDEEYDYTFGKIFTRGSRLEDCELYDVLSEEEIQ